MRCECCGTMCEGDKRTICNSCLPNTELVKSWGNMVFFRTWLYGFSVLSFMLTIALLFYAYLYIFREGYAFLFVINYFGFWAFVKCAKDSWFEYQKHHDAYYMRLLEA
jgi:hypothetical protein